MLLTLALLGCPAEPTPDSEGPAPESLAESVAPEPSPRELKVRVTLDGAPVEGAVLSQGGRPTRWTTDSAGEATVTLDETLDGDWVIMASHPQARIDGEQLYKSSADSGEETLEIALVSFATTDNRTYTFQDPGDPSHYDSANYCAHCHVTLNAAWFASPHRTSASDPRVQDLYAGVASGFGDAELCATQSGRWWVGVEPGTGLPAARCYLGAGVLPDLNPDCGTESPCDGVATRFGACADCHAPGIDGKLGGRDLLEATGIAYNYGVHCDVCHKVEALDLDAEAGVAGRLKILRPTEEQDGPLGPWVPLTFGPYDDVINPRMGSVERDFFHEAELCAGCHELEQAALVPGQSLDPSRWPEGRLPIHSTYSEWSQGPFSPNVPCQSCHMPADATVGNSADLGNEFDIPAGVAGGWYRNPGEVRQHSWVGPSQPDLGMLAVAAFLSLDSSLDGETLTVRATVRNSGPGHALPTGEPLRAMLLVVEASCEGVALTPIGGDVVPDFGGALAQKASGEDWTLWPGASVGDLLRVVRRTGDWYDYTGYGPFGDGRFSAAEKGMPVERYVGEVTITAVDAEGRVSTSSPLPVGDRIYRVRAGWPSEADALPLAGAPGFGFARVLTDASGARQAPHHRATDIASDNRILPQQEHTSTHLFQATCAQPQLRGALLWRPVPLELATQRGWTLQDQIMTQVTR